MQYFNTQDNGLAPATPGYAGLPIQLPSYLKPNTQSITQPINKIIPQPINPSTDFQHYSYTPFVQVPNADTPQARLPSLSSKTRLPESNNIGGVNAVNSAKYVAVNSAFRISGTSNSFTAVLGQPVIGAAGLRLLHAKFPNTVYNVTTVNQNITFTYNAVQYTAVVPVGAYNATQLLGAVQNRMNVAASVTTFTVVQNLFTLTTTIASSALPFVLNFGTGINQLNYLLGFMTVDTGSSTSQTGAYVLNLGFPTHLLIYLSPGGAVTTNNSSIGSPSLIIPFDVNTNLIESYNVNSYYPYISLGANSVIDRLTVDVRDFFGNPVSFNGSDIQLLFEAVWRNFENGIKTVASPVTGT